MKQAKGALGKLDSLWSDGVYLGIKGKTGEIIVGDAEGVWRTRSIRRKPEAERWRDTHIHGCRAPWNHGKHDLEPDGEALPAVTMEPREIEDAKMQDSERLGVDIGGRTLRLERNGGSRFWSVRRTKIRTTSEAAREHSHQENLE